ncbi:MAG: 5-carboxymethyl-2-hydroxymuconate isomerase [Roseovarius sp.]|nr:5-carboxymethyl-2-hydroxymuconate isomerase [Roseovarius sp.]
MPHLSIEFSKGLERTNDFQLLCSDLCSALASLDAFDDPASIKVRVKPIEFFSIGSEPQTFVHATLMLMAGCDELMRKHLNEAILEILDRALPEVGSITV